MEAGFGEALDRGVNGMVGCGDCKEIDLSLREEEHTSWGSIYEIEEVVCFGFSG